MDLTGYKPDPAASARRNLAQRIEDFRPQRVLTPFEERSIELARECLDSGQYRLGEEYMHKAQRADVFDPGK